VKTHSGLHVCDSYARRRDHLKSFVALLRVIDPGPGLPFIAVNEVFLEFLERREAGR